MSPAIWRPSASNISRARSVSRIAMRSGIRTMKNEVRRWSTIRSVKRVILVWISWSSRRTSSSETLPPFNVAATASYSCAFSRASVIFPTHLLKIPAIATIRVDLHDIQVRNDADQPFPEDVPVEDVAQARLRIRREAEDLPIPLRGHVMAQPRAARRLAEAPLPREDHDSLVAFLLKERGKAHRFPQNTWSVKSRSRKTRCFQLLMFGTAYGRIRRE